MPVQQVNQYTSPITGDQVYSDSLPAGWHVVNGDVFAPGALLLLAKRLMANPQATQDELLVTATPDEVTWLQSLAG